MERISTAFRVNPSVGEGWAYFSIANNIYTSLKFVHLFCCCTHVACRSTTQESHSFDVRLPRVTISHVSVFLRHLPNYYFKQAN